MKAQTEHDDLLSAELETCQLLTPSSGLKKRVLIAAHHEWQTHGTPAAESSWGFPVFRLAASITFAVFLVYLASWADIRSTTRWQVTEQTFRSTSGTVNELLVPHQRAGWAWLTVATARLPQSTSAESLQHRIHRIDEMLNSYERDFVDPIKSQSL